MLRWVLLAAIAFGVVNGVQRGWLELHWDRLLRDAGIPGLSGPVQRPTSLAEPLRSSLQQA
jgi:hypothetical protein